MLDSTVVFNEIMYNPVGGEDVLEWVELYNQLAVNVDLSGWRVDGTGYEIPEGTTIPGGGYLLIAKDPAQFEQATGLADVLGPYAGQLSNGGEQLELQNNSGRIIDALDYSDGGDWPVAPDGSGASLAKLAKYIASGPAANWTTSFQVGGTPGAKNFIGDGSDVVDLFDAELVATVVPAAPDALPQLVINEITADGDASFFVELKNVGDDPIEVAGMVLRSSDPLSTPLTLPAQTVPPGEFLVLRAADLGPGLSPVSGDRLFLYTAGGSSVLDARRVTGRLRGRTDQYAGEWLFPSAATPGAENSFDLRDEIVINEIMFHHSPKFASDRLLEKSTLIPLEATWQVDQSNALPGADWMAPGFDDSGFGSGDAIFFAGPFDSTDNPNRQPIATLFGTGFDNSGQLLAAGQVDPNWTITGPAGPSGAFVVVSDGFPIPPWLANDAQSQWISTQPTNNNNGPPGDYTYQTTFDLTGYVPDLAELSFTMTADDQIIDVLINGQSTGKSYTGFGGISAPQAITTGFVGGVNTLSFVVRNGEMLDNPTGFRVALSGTAQPLRANTELLLGIATSYFRTEFDFAGDPSQTSLELASLVDDGAVIYLNGVEVLRQNMPAGPVLHATPAVADIPGSANFSAPVVIPPEQLVVGTNVLAVEIHQAAGGSNDMAFGLALSATETLSQGSDFQEDPEEWIELFNRGESTVDLAGWQLDGAVRFDFPLGTTLAAGDYLVVANDAAALAASRRSVGGGIIGDFSGRLSNRGETIELIDAANNPADRVSYFDKGRWPSLADGGGSSLELRDPTADNSKAEAWSASDQSDQSAWQTISYRGIASPPPGSNDPVLWNEFIFGLLDAGEILIDDISVIEDPDGAALQLIQNGSFDAGTDSYRMQGNHGSHGLNRIIEDPAAPGSGNQVLNLIATSGAEPMYNHVETTFADNRSIVFGREYEISYRAKWISGSPQLNTRLYFNLLARTTILDVPTAVGTPGEANSPLQASPSQVNIGPTYDSLRHGPVVPTPGQAVTISVGADDPDGVSSMMLFYSVDGGATQSVPMNQPSAGQYQAVIPTQAGGAVVQFYVEGVDTLGAASTFPADGADSRALFQVDDGSIPKTSHNEFRLIMTDADEDVIHLNTNSLSNDRIGATVIFNGTEVYYNVGVRMKGSGFSRPSDRAGYNLRFTPDNLFRGVHDTIAIDRNGLAMDQNGSFFGVGASHREMVLKQITAAAGGLPVMYDDMIYLKSSRAGFSGTAQLLLARYDNEFLDASYENGSDGTRFKFDLVYWSNVIPDGGVEATKNTPNTVLGVDISDLSDDKEVYRNRFLIRNGRAADDFSRIIELGQTLSLPGGDNGSELDVRSQQVMDVDQWLRNFAFTSLGGIGDTYNQGLPHNIQLFVRPEDSRVVVLPWDMDFAFSQSTSMPLDGTGSNFRKVINIPNNRHYYLGHLENIIATTFNTTYLTPWVEELATFAEQDESAAILDYVQQRSAFVLSQLPAATPFLISNISPLDVGASRTAPLSGTGWVNVREIRLAGSNDPLDIVWTTDTLWTTSLPLSNGTNDYTLEAYDFEGQLIDTSTITISSTSPHPLVDNLRIVELMYNPPSRSAAEIAAGFTNDNDFEFIELLNISTTETIDLAGAAFTDGIRFTFDGSVSLGPGERMLAVRDIGAFETRYGQPNVPMVEYGNGLDGAGMFKLSNGGETVRLVDDAGAVILSFVYDDSSATGWYDETDGDGRSLVFVDATDAAADWGDPTHYRASVTDGGSPGEADRLRADLDGNGQVGLLDLARFQTGFNQPGGSRVSDLNGDSLVSRSGVVTMIGSFGQSYHVASSGVGAGGSPEAPVALIHQLGDEIFGAIVRGNPAIRRLNATRTLSRRSIPKVAAETHLSVTSADVRRPASRTTRRAARRGIAAHLADKVFADEL